MFDLWFLTTNAIKLSHFRYLARGAGIVINSFHERTYYGSYQEPKIKDRDELLKSSYESALMQWKRAGYSDEAFFCFEDTSVIINALSKDGEFPGTDVKYWMKETKFSGLDEIIKACGNDRSVSVRSDIILHLPFSVRSTYGLDDSYLQFTGITHGFIISSERTIKSNPLRPWQDASSFNKWFVPHGENKPYSLLSARAELKYDFRRKAFSQLRNFVEKIGFKLEEDNRLPRQLALHGVAEVPPLFLICGPSGSGKTTVAEFLVKNFGYMHFEASDFMRLAYYERLGRNPTVKISNFATAVLKEEPWTVPSKIVEYAGRFSGSPFVVTGFRSQKEINGFEELYKQEGKIVRVFVDASLEVRYGRVCKRNRDDVPNSLLDMDRKDREQQKMGLLKIKNESEVNLIRNESTRKIFLSTFQKYFLSEYSFAKKSRNIFTSKGIHSLEEAIIFSLGDDGGEKNYTTTMLARLINDGNRRRFQTEKDNVSRFFNQKFSPFFSMKFDHGKARYSLSQTGISFYLRLSDMSIELPRKEPQRHSDGFQADLF